MNHCEKPGLSIPARAQALLVYAPLNSMQLHWLGPVLEQALSAAVKDAVVQERERCIRLCEMTEASDELHSMDWREAARTCRELIAGEEET